MGIKGTFHKIGVWRDAHPGTAMCIEIAAILLMTWVGTKRTYRRAFNDGYAAGTNPLKQAELTSSYNAGNVEGYSKGLWASQPEAYREGMADGANLAADANMVAFDAIRRSQNSAYAVLHSTPTSVAA